MWLAKYPFVLRKTRTSSLTKWAVSVCTHQCGRLLLLLLLLHPHIPGRVLRLLVYVMWPVNAKKSVIAVMHLKILCENWFCFALFWHSIDSSHVPQVHLPFNLCRFNLQGKAAEFGKGQSKLVAFVPFVYRRLYLLHQALHPCSVSPPLARNCGIPFSFLFFFPFGKMNTQDCQ